MKKSKLLLNISLVSGTCLAPLSCSLASCSCEHKDVPTDIVISPSELSFEVNDATRLTAVVNPVGVSQDVIWKSNDESIVDVQPDGLAIANGVGHTTIIATSVVDPSVKEECEVQVSSLPPMPETNKPIPTTEFVVKNGILMGLKQPWEEYSNYDEIYIPNTIKSINARAFASNKKNGYIPSTITKLSFEEGLEEDMGNALVINDDAFLNCDSLMEIAFPKRLQYVGERAFAGCKKVRSLDFSSWDETRAKDINPFSNLDIFKGWKYRGTILTSDATNTVRDTLYYVLTAGGLSKEWFPDVNIVSGETIDTKNVTITFDIVNGDYAIITGLKRDSTSKLNEWVIPSKITHNNASYYVIGIAPFATTGNNFVGVKKISLQNDNYLSAIGACAFSQCKDLETIDLTSIDTSTGNEGTKFKLIDTAAFENLSKLQTVTVPNSLNAIGSWAFSNDISLSDTNISLKRTSVNKIMPGVFYNCVNIRNLDFLNASTTWIGSYAFALSQETDKGIADCELPNNTVYIGDHAFEYQNIEDVSLFFLTKYVGDFAFAKCPKLETVTIFESLEYFGAGAISNTPVLRDIAVREDPMMGEKHFKCIQSTLFTIDGTELVAASGDSAKLPDEDMQKVTKIGPYAYAGVNMRFSPDSVDLSGFTNLTTIDDYALAGIKVVRDRRININLPESVESIGNYAFYQSDIDNDVLFSIIRSLPNLVSWGDYMFSECPLVSILPSIPTITSIPEGSFANCPNIKTIYIANTIGHIGDKAFANCTSLLDINLSEFESVPTTWYVEDEKPFDITLTRSVRVKISDMSLEDDWRTLLASMGVVETDQNKLSFYTSN